MDNEVKTKDVTVRVEAHYDSGNHSNVYLHLFVTYNGWLIYHTDHTYHYNYNMSGVSGYNHTGSIKYTPDMKPVSLAFLYEKQLGGTDEEWRKFFEGIRDHVFHNIFPAKLHESDVVYLWAKRIKDSMDDGTYKSYNRDLIAKWEYSLEIPFNV